MSGDIDFDGARFHAIPMTTSFLPVTRAPAAPHRVRLDTCERSYPDRVTWWREPLAPVRRCTS